MTSRGQTEPTPGRSTESSEPDDTVRVVGICGSLRPGSYTRQVLQLALDGAESSGATTELIDLSTYHLVFCDGDNKEDQLPDDVFTLRKKVKEAHGLILGTPEYHGSYSGVLKNSLDLMGFDELEGKLVGLVGVSGGELGAINALNGLRTVGRALHAWVIPQQVSVPKAWDAFDEKGVLKNANMTKRLHAVGQTVASYAALHNSDSAADFMRLWEGAPTNPGG